jgi:hypothetical protein
VGSNPTPSATFEPVPEVHCGAAFCLRSELEFRSESGAILALVSPVMSASETALPAWWATICVQLDAPQPLEGEDGTVEGEIVGYYRNYGITAASEVRLRELIEAVVGDGKIDWQETEWHQIEPGDDRIPEGPTGEGIWHESGRLLFEKDQDRDELRALLGDGDSLDFSAQLWKEHPRMVSTLLVATLLPGVVLLTAAGILLDRFFPKPPAWIAIAGLFAFLSLFLVGMLIGAFVWIHIAKYFADAHLVQRMFCGPSIPVFSNACEWIYRSAFGAPSERN